MDKNAIKALLIMGLFMVLYFQFVMPLLVDDKDPTPEETQDDTPVVNPYRNGNGETADDDDTQPSDDDDDPAPADDDDVADDDASVTPAPGAVAALDQQGRSSEPIVIDTRPEAPREGMILVFNPVGGSLQKIVLKEFAPLPIDTDRLNEAVNPDKRLALIRPGEGHLQPGQLVDPKGKVPFDSAIYEKRYDRAAGSVTFSAAFSNGVEVVKTYTLSEGDYRVDLSVRIRNGGDRPARITHDIVAAAGLTSEEFRREDRNVVAYNPKDLRTEDFAGLLDDELAQDGASADVSPTSGQGVRWAGAANRYFALVLAALSETPGATVGAAARAKRMEGNPAGHEEEKYMKDQPGNVAVLLTPSLPTDLLEEGRMRPGTSFTRQYFFFAGPKTDEVLQAEDLKAIGIHELLDYGWTHYLVQIVVWVVGIFHSFLRNWGLAIILLTVLIRLGMHRLTKKSQMTMAKMQELQPKVKAIQEKYKNDKQKLAEEQMKIYKEHGNPFLGGCLPMLLQLPIFISLYRGLNMNIALRQASLFPQSWGWMTDLSQPDRLYEFANPINLPFGMALYEINLLPLLMIGLMFLQMKMQPSNPDPQARQQQKMMTVMMALFFGLIFYYMPSGLTLYFIVSTGWGLIEGKIIRRHIEQEKAAKAAAKADGKNA